MFMSNHYSERLSNRSNDLATALKTIPSWYIQPMSSWHYAVPLQWIWINSRCKISSPHLTQNCVLSVRHVFKYAHLSSILDVASDCVFYVMNSSEARGMNLIFKVCFTVSCALRRNWVNTFCPLLNLKIPWIKHARHSGRPVACARTSEIAQDVNGTRGFEEEDFYMKIPRKKSHVSVCCVN